MTSKVWLSALLVTFSSDPSWAQISLRIRADTTVKPPHLSVRLRLTNEGKEEAHKLQVSLRNAGRTITLLERTLLAPGASHETEADLNIEGSAPGKHPLFVTVGYSDRNGYQFSAILCATFFIQQDTTSDVFGTLKTTPLADTGKIQLKLKNLAMETRSFSMTLFTPRELSADYDQKMTLRPGEERSLVIPVRNFSALPGSRYPVYAVVEYEKEGQHFTNAILSHIETVAQIGFFTRHRLWILSVAGLFFVLGIQRLLVHMRKKDMSPTPAHSNHGKP